MANRTTQVLRRAREFYFPGLTLGKPIPQEVSRLWFRGGPDFDEKIRREFGDDIEGALRGEFDSVAGPEENTVGLVLLLDQFTRNVYRGTAKMFAGDAKCLDLVNKGIEQKLDENLVPWERMFFYMPLMHSESLADQDRCIALYTRAEQTADPLYKGLFQGNIVFAHKHRDIIVRFGKFPHRDEILGRESTEEQRQYVEEHGGF